MKKFLRFTTGRYVLTEKSSKTFLKGKLLNTPIHSLCAVSSGQDSIVSFFLLLHSCFLSLPKSSFSDNKIYPKNIFYKKNKLFSEEKPLVEGNTDLVVEFKKTPSTFQAIYCQHFWQTKNFYSSQSTFTLSFFIEVPYTMILPKNTYLKENCSRSWRKKNFCRLARLQKLSTVSTGHTRSDSFEKNLNNLLRGTSPKSLSEFIFVNSKITVGSYFSTLILQPNNQIELQPNKNKRSDLDEKLCFGGFKVNPSQKFYDLATEKERVIKNENNRFNKIKFVRYQKDKKFSFSKKYSETEKTSVIKKTIQEKRRLSFPRIPQSLVNSQIKKKDSICLAELKTSSSFCFSSKICKSYVKFFKPLQNNSRLTVSKLSTVYDLPVISDVTNFSSLFSRNKIRHQLVPFLRCLFQIKCESQLTKFFSLLAKQYKQLENKLFEVYIVFNLLKMKSLQPKEFSSQSAESIDVRFFSTLINKSELSLHSSLIQKITYEYKEIEFSFSQINDLQILCKVNKNRQIF